MTRYRQTPAPARVTQHGDELNVRFDSLHEAIAPGSWSRCSTRPATKCSAPRRFARFADGR